MPKQQTPDQIARLVISENMSSAELADEVLEELVKIEAMVAEQATALYAQQKRIRAVLLENLTKTTKLAGRTVVVKQLSNFDKAAFSAHYTAAEFPHLYEQVLISTTAMKEHLLPGEIAKFKVPGARSIEIRG